MKKVNTHTLAEETWSSPKGKFAGAGKEISEALGRKPHSADLLERHPFDVEIIRLSPGQIPYPYHLHSAQWEFYHVISGKGSVRHADGTTEMLALVHSFSAAQLEWFRAGSALNLFHAA